MVDTIKFSAFANAGDISPDQMTVGLHEGVNARFNNPFPLLAPGSDGDRPPIGPDMYYRLRFNTTLERYEYYSPTELEWIQLVSTSSFIYGPFVTFTHDPNLPDAFNLANLASNGILKQTVSLGVATPNLAVNGIDFYGPGFTGYLAAPAGVKDVNDNTVLSFLNDTNAVNHLAVMNAATGTPVSLLVEGTDTDIDLSTVLKGTGKWYLSSEAANALTVNNGSGYQHVTNFLFATTANETNITFQDVSGTVAYLDDIPSDVVLSAQGTANQVLVNGTSGTPVSGDIILTLPQNIAAASAPTFANLTLSGGSIFDANAHIVYQLNATASAVNYLAATNQVTGVSPSFSANGADANIGMGFLSKGSGQLTFSSLNSTPLIIRSGTTYQHITNFLFSNTAATRNVTLQDASGTVAYLTDIPSVTPSALTVTSDSNVTLSLTGTPSTALLQGVGITAGWSGQVPLDRGGSNASLTASNGGVICSNASAFQVVAGTGTAGKMFRSGINVPGSWSTNVWPNTTPINNLIYATSANTFGNLATQVSSLLTTDASGLPAWLTTGTSFTATVTLTTVGDLSVAYTRQEGTYWRLANLVFCRIRVDFTPTYMTASGNVTLAAPLPVATNGNIAGLFTTPLNPASGNFVFPAGKTTILPSATPGTSSLILISSGSGVLSSPIDQDSIPSTVAQSFQIFCLYIGT